MNYTRTIEEIESSLSEKREQENVEQFKDILRKEDIDLFE